MVEGRRNIGKLKRIKKMIAKMRHLFLLTTCKWLEIMVKYSGIHGGVFMDNVNLRVSEEVVSAIAYKTILEIPGVFEINGNIIDELTNMLGSKAKNKRTRGIKVDFDENQILLDTYLTVEYGVKIPDIAWDIQDKVKKTLEESTGMKVRAVNVHIQGINFDKKKSD